MSVQMPEMTREFLEAECLKRAKTALGCSDLTAVKIAAAPPGGGPNWYVESFVPPLPPIAEKEARAAVIGLTGACVLTGA